MDTTYTRFPSCGFWFLVAFAVQAPFCLAQVSPPEWGCHIRYDHDEAGNRTSRYWYCWGESPNKANEAPEDPETGRMEHWTMEVHPNPAHDMITISLTDAIDHAQYSILDMHGRQVLKGSFQGERMTVMITGLAPGPYLIRLKRESEMFVRQLVVE